MGVRQDLITSRLLIFAASLWFTGYGNTAKTVSCFDEVYVATDSDEIKNVAEGFGANVIMTSSDCETATERLYEVSKENSGRFVCNGKR